MKFGVEERGKSPGIGIIETLRERDRERVPMRPPKKTGERIIAK